MTLGEMLDAGAKLIADGKATRESRLWMLPAPSDDHCPSFGVNDVVQAGSIIAIGITEKGEEPVNDIDGNSDPLPTDVMMMPY